MIVKLKVMLCLVELFLNADINIFINNKKGSTCEMQKT